MRGKHSVKSSDHSSALPLPAGTPGGVPFPPEPSPLLQSHRPQSGSSLSTRTRTSYRPKLTRSNSSGLSTDLRSTDESTTIVGGPAISQQSLPVVPEDTDRFASLVSQIDLETEAALAFARSEESSSQRTTGSSPGPERDEDSSEEEDDQNATPRYEDEDDFYGARPRVPPVLGFNEFGQPYPPEEDIPMLNGYIRRMPTIESMGSREMGSSIAGSSMLARDREHDPKRESTQTNRSLSRPPTRTARASWGSEMSSRTNSLGVQVEKAWAGSNGHSRSSSGHGMSEMGELLDVHGNVVGRKSNTPDSLTGTFNLSVPSSTTGSRSTNMTYFTATSGSAKTEISSVEEGSAGEHGQKKEVSPATVKIGSALNES